MVSFSTSMIVEEKLRLRCLQKNISKMVIYHGSKSKLIRSAIS